MAPNSNKVEEFIVNKTAVEGSEPAPKLTCWEQIKVYCKCTWQEWYNEVAIMVVLTYEEIAHAVDVTWLWIRDYILGGIAVVIVLIALGIKEILGYFASCLARRMEINEFGEKESD